MTHGLPPVSQPGQYAADGTAAEATCQNCGLPLVREEIWGWIHANGQYLCYDPTTGEPMSLPAQPNIP